VYNYNQITGVLESVTYASGVVAIFTYDERNRMLTNTRGDLTIEYVYQRDRLTTIKVLADTIPGTQFKIDYNTFGKLMAIQVGDGTSWTALANYSYDVQGKPIRTQYANEYIVTYEYNAINQVTREVVYDNLAQELAGRGQKIEYYYDAWRQLVLQIDELSGTSVRTEYDSSGSYLGEVRYNATNPTQFTSANVIFRYQPLESRIAGTSIYTDRYALDYGGMSSTYETQRSTINGNEEVLTTWQGALGTVGSLSRIYRDKFGRISRIRADATGGPIETYYDYVSGGQAYSTSNRVAAIYTSTETLKYDYDDVGNIAKIKDGNDVIQNQYAYDPKGQLVREDNRELGISREYIYDPYGNFVAQITYPFSLGTLATQIDEVTYAYGNPQWLDQLTEYDGHAFTYDAMGNPLAYRDGITLTWGRARQLTSMTKGGATTNYTYYKEGNRQSKIVGGVTTEYYYHNDNIHGWKDNSGNWMQFQIDTEGNYISFIYNGTRYWYVRNLQGDVLAILDEEGHTVASYTYDAWGNHVVKDAQGNLLSDIFGSPLIGEGSEIGNLNPIRYRCYFFDTDTGLYYLMSRYYDAQTGRFLNADDPTILYHDYISQIHNNIFAYCGNNPVVCIDKTGEWISWIVAAVAVGIGVILYGCDDTSRNPTPPPQTSPSTPPTTRTPTPPAPTGSVSMVSPNPTAARAAGQGIFTKKGRIMLKYLETGPTSGKWVLAGGKLKGIKTYWVGETRSDGSKIYTAGWGTQLNDEMLGKYPELGQYNGEGIEMPISIANKYFNLKVNDGISALNEWCRTNNISLEERQFDALMCVRYQYSALENTRPEAGPIFNLFPLIRTGNRDRAAWLAAMPGSRGDPMRKEYIVDTYLYANSASIYRYHGGAIPESIPYIAGTTDIE